MTFFRKIIINLLAFIFGSFLLGPNFIAHGESEVSLTITGYASPCVWNMQCEILDETHYVCFSNSEIISGKNTSHNQVPVGKYSGDISDCESKGTLTSLSGIQEKKILYEGPDTYVYPFVSIIKIQV